VNDELVGAVFLRLKGASVNAGGAAVHLTLALMAVVYYEQLAARRGHKAVMTGAENACRNGF